MGIVVAVVLMIMSITSAAYHFWPTITAAPQILTIAGLSLDAFGVMLLVLFRPSIVRRSALLLQNQTAFSEWCAKLEPSVWWAGPLCLVSGFALQIFGSFILIDLAALASAGNSLGP